jgi:hypothetical protein
MDLFAKRSSAIEGGAGGSAVAGYDRVSITAADGATRDLTRSEYQKLPLPERVRLLLELRARFFAGEREVPPSQALS